MADLKLIKPLGIQNIINKFCFTIGMIPTSYKLSLTYEEQILAIGQYLEETVIPALNNNAEAVRELQTLFVQLKDYVENYFDDLNIQEEINIKLNEMAQDGTLTDIITQYVELKSVLAFDNVENMKNATNLINGSIVRTLGYSSYKDGLGSFYRIRTITSSDIIDNVNIIALLNSETLIAEKVISQKIKYVNTVEDLKNTDYLQNGDVVITKGYYSINDGGSAKYIITSTNNEPNEMDKLTLKNNLFATLIVEHPLNCKQVGCKGDGVQDDTLFLQRAINITLSGCFIPRGTYKVTDTLSFENKTIIGENYTWVTIKGEIEDASKPIIAVGGASNLQDITVAYDKSIVRTDLSGKVGIRLYGGYRNLKMQQGSIRNCQVSNCGTGITDGGASVFSCVFDTIKINNFGRYGFAMTGGARTGNVYSNIYINNHDFIVKGELDSVQAFQAFYLIGEESECTIQQLNVEHLTAYQPIYISNVHGLFASSIHVEGTMCRGTYQPFVYIDKTYGKIENISFYYTRHTNGQSLIKLGEVQNGDTDNDFFGGEKILEIGNLECKGLNRPDRETYGYEPAYPVTASTISTESSVKNFAFIDRESSSNRYKVALHSFNWQTFSYQYNDSDRYKAFPNNRHGSILWTKLGAKASTYSTAGRPTNMLFDGLQIYDYTLNKPIWYNSGKWRDASGNTV